MSQIVSEPPEVHTPPSNSAPLAQPIPEQPVVVQTAAPPTYIVAPQPVYVAPMAHPGRGLCIAAMVCGIVGIAFAFIPFVGVFVAVVLGILATAMGAVGRSRATQKGMGTTGLVLGILSIVVAIGWWVVPMLMST